MKYDLELDIDENNSLKLILQQITEGATILEFGPANGRLTKYLKRHLKCKVYTVEIDAEAAVDAAKYSEDIIVGDIEEFEWLEKWHSIKFDYIIFADVLEHLRNPQEVLSRTKRLLKDDGKVVCSIPNVAHNSILINLYNNIFNYTPLGLLDNTHIHLFAYNTLKEFCHYAGYYPVIEDATYSAVGENEISNSYSEVSNEVGYALKQREYGNVYQFVFTLQKLEYIKNNKYQSDYRIKAKVPQHFFKVYVDRGIGWCESNCISYKVNAQPQVEYKIKLEDCEDIKALRIDPLDANGVYRIDKIRIVDDAGIREYGLQELCNNGVIRDNYFYCDNDDPQIIISNVTLKGNAILEISYGCLFTDINNKVIVDFVAMVRHAIEKDKEISSVRMEFQKFQEEADRKIGEQENIIRSLQAGMQKEQAELERRMDEITRRDREIQEQEEKIHQKEKQIETLLNEKNAMRVQLEKHSNNFFCRTKKNFSNNNK